MTFSAMFLLFFSFLGDKLLIVTDTGVLLLEGRYSVAIRAFALFKYLLAYLYRRIILHIYDERINSVKLVLMKILYNAFNFNFV